MGEYIQQQIQNSAKIEATIGMGITAIITTYVITDTVNGGGMPNWALVVLGMLLLSFFAIRILAYFRFLVEREMYMKELKIQGEVKQMELRTQITLTETRIRLKELEAVEKIG